MKATAEALRAAKFERNPYDYGRRFGFRILGTRSWQVYGRHLTQVAMCDTREDAEMVRDALEMLALSIPSDDHKTKETK